jgi:UDP-2,4-diacetamido-2,4,6-trideoxy-beta-L-altropyranose hydrolase
LSLEILIRVDSSSLIGSGHVVRCLNLAKRLRLRGCNVLFITRENSSNCNFLFFESNFDVIVMAGTHTALRSDAKEDDEYKEWLGVSQEQDAQDTIESIGDKIFDWIIIDHYALDHRWQDLLSARAEKIMVIDDLANRVHNCDLLLDQNFFLNKSERYSALVPSNCKCLLGPTHLLVSAQYDKYRSADKLRKGSISRVLVFFGSVDNAKQTELAIAAISSLNKTGIVFDVIVGKSNTRAASIKQLCDAVQNIRFHCQVDNMSEFIFKADFALGAGGASLWERAKLGLPSAVTVVANNQIEATENAEKTGVIVNLGFFSKVSSQSYSNILGIMIESPERLRDMSDACIRLFNDSASSDVVDLIVN